MVTSFDNKLYRLEFKKEILDNPIIIEIFKGTPNPYYTIDPLNTIDELREYYYYEGLDFLFDVVLI